MSGICYNVLYIKGDSDDVSQFFAFMGEILDIDTYLWNVGKQELEEGSEFDLDFSCSSLGPCANTVVINDKTILWEAEDCPSLFTVFGLSKQFQNLAFDLDFDNIPGELVGNIVTKSGVFLHIDIVSFEHDACTVLWDNYKYEMLALREGDEMNVGRESVQVTCTSEEETETEIRKSFDLIFDCDASPKIVIRIEKIDGETLDYLIECCENGFDIQIHELNWNDVFVSYADDDGHKAISEHPNHKDMIADVSSWGNW
jgi:hypothetical protein